MVQSLAGHEICDPATDKRVQQSRSVSKVVVQGGRGHFRCGANRTGCEPFRTHTLQDVGGGLQDRFFSAAHHGVSGGFHRLDSLYSSAIVPYYSNAIEEYTSWNAHVWLPVVRALWVAA